MDRMFRSGLPKGWTHWGFKEIRYGLHNNAPRVLLDLFPTATAVFTFREPKGTIESMIRAWGRPGLLDAEASLDGLSEDYEHSSDIWRTIMKYFLEYRRNGSRRITFVSGNNLNKPVAEIMHILRLSITRNVPSNLGITNPGPDLWPEWAREKFNDLFAKDEPEYLDIFTNACIASDEDFGLLNAKAIPDLISRVDNR
jgi:hypothetical protein